MITQVSKSFTFASILRRKNMKVEETPRKRFIPNLDLNAPPYCLTAAAGTVLAGSRDVRQSVFEDIPVSLQYKIV